MKRLHKQNAGSQMDENCGGKQITAEFASHYIHPNFDDESDASHGVTHNPLMLLAQTCKKIGNSSTLPENQTNDRSNNDSMSGLPVKSKQFHSSTNEHWHESTYHSIPPNSKADKISPVVTNNAHPPSKTSKCGVQFHASPHKIRKVQKEEFSTREENCSSNSPLSWSSAKSPIPDIHLKSPTNKPINALLKSCASINSTSIISPILPAHNLYVTSASSFLDPPSLYSGLSHSLLSTPYLPTRNLHTQAPSLSSLEQLVQQQTSATSNSGHPDYCTCVLCLHMHYTSRIAALQSISNLYTTTLSSLTTAPNYNNTNYFSIPSNFPTSPVSRNPLSAQYPSGLDLSGASTNNHNLNIEYCMYCGKHFPILNELLVHLHQHGYRFDLASNSSQRNAFLNLFSSMKPVVSSNEKSIPALNDEFMSLLAFKFYNDALQRSSAIMDGFTSFNESRTPLCNQTHLNTASAL